MKTVRNTILILLAGILAGFLLLTAVYALPLQNLEKHVAESVPAFENQAAHQRVGKFANACIDNFSDALMLEMASYNGPEPLIEKVVYSFYMKCKGFTPNESIIMHYNGSESGVEPAAQAYAQYWHGYVNTLRPLLSIMNYQQIRTLNMLCLAGGWVVVLILILRRLRSAVLPFVVTSLFFVPTIVYKSLHYSSVIYVELGMLAAMLLLSRRERRAQTWYYLFLIAGMCTSYLDLLTCPTITLTLPLFMLCGLHFKDTHTLKYRILLVLRCCIGWGIGYAVMWAGKWFIVFLLAGKDFIPYLLGEMQVRSSATSSHPLIRFIVIAKNIFKLCCDYRLDILFVLAFGFILRRCIRVRSRISSKWNVILTFAFIALIPFGWTFIMSNHSDIHSLFTFRLFAPLIFAALFLPNLLVDKCSST